MADADIPDATVKRESSTDEELAHGINTAHVGSNTDRKPSQLQSDVDASLDGKGQTPAAGVKSESDDSKQAFLGKDDDTETNGHISPKKEAQRSKSSRSASQKIPPRIAPLLNSLPDMTDEANSAYTVIDACTYQNKYLGYTEHAMECDCSEEWDSATKTNYACGEDSDCINRATKMECIGDCACGADCQNQRFVRQMYSDVSVIKTEKKGYGLRTNVDLKNGDFIFEYIGEVIAEAAFRRRMVQYDEEGIKHFYFMSLSKGEFVDATRKGNLGRFCNHSCNPNCYVDKWVVGDKLRMGIFAERKIKAGEELVFNYNVDRYGANPQPCYCGETNCTGFIGGKTQTERATKLSAATIEALGIDDDFDSWDTVVAKKPKKKKTGEDDEEYVDSIEAKVLDANGVTKVMAALMQCKEKWIAVRLLQRIQRSGDEDVRHRIVKLHGYQIMNSQLSAWRDDENVILQILDILDTFPRLTRNKIVDAKIDKTLEPLAQHADERVASKARSLLVIWSELELAYRIPRKARQAAGVKQDGIKFERRESTQQRRRSRSRSRSRSKSPPRGPGAVVPAGPRAQQRPQPPPFRRAPPPLPKGWSQAKDESTGRTYFYTSTGKTQWVRPTQPAEQTATPTLPKQPSQQDVLKSIIDDIVSSKEKDKEKEATKPVSTVSESSKKEKRVEKWKSYDEEKQRKLYENTLFPHISHVMSKYKHKIPKDDLKRFGKEIARKLVSSDYKAGRVKDPTKIDEKQQKKVKAFCKEYFDKAVQKHQKHEADRAARKALKETARFKIASSTDATPGHSPASGMTTTPVKVEVEEIEEDDDDEEMKISDNEIESDHESPEHTSPTQSTVDTLKRKRTTADANGFLDDGDSELLQSPAKKQNFDSETTSTMPPPPPPPAPPADSPPETGSPAQEDYKQDSTVTDIHADTNFKRKSMADVLAQAQAEDGNEEDEDVDMLKEETTIKGEDQLTKFEAGLTEKNIDVTMENPIVDGQAVVERIKAGIKKEYRDEDEVEWA